MDRDNKVNAYLRTKCTMSLMNLPNRTKTHDDHHEMTMLSSFTKADLRSQKSGEILRNKFGKFSFLCTQCDTLRENCQDIMDHIDSHFDKENSITHQNIEMILPEFVSAGEIKPDPDMETTITPNEIFPNVSSQPKPMIKLEVSNTDESNDCEMKLTAADKSESFQKPSVVRIIKLKPVKVRAREKILSERSKMLSKVVQKNISSDCEPKPCQNKPTVRIVKLKPIKFYPSQRTFAERKKMLSIVDPKNGLTKPTNVVTTKTPSEVIDLCLEGDLEPANKPKLDESTPSKELNSIEPKKQMHIRPINRCKCYQCEMEPMIYNTKDPRRHICLFCPKWFPNHFEFEAHANAVHNKDGNYVCCKDFYCYVCEKKFPFRNYLVNHLKLHNQSAYHLCPTCGSRFKTNTRLTEHMKIHDEKTFKCDECGKVFKRFDRLRQHLWCHNTDLSFVCQVCSKAFKMKRYLNRHMAVHNDAKINCRHCDATFNFVSVRRAHEISRHNVV